MAEARVLDELARALRRAADTADWTALAAADAALAERLRALAVRGVPLDAAERAALAGLQAAHGHARG
ncbi:hypothetical protein CKO44_21940, partial [Rubrivivax gelatinosus]|nr:hypothetical protein [Rubrivivax gelatinosus]